MDGTLFMGRLITVAPKRKNIPGRGRARAENPMMAMMRSLMMGGMRGGRGAMRGMMGMRGGRGGRGGPPGSFRGGMPPGGGQGQS
jgi:hypothetical protein